MLDQNQILALLDEHGDRAYVRAAQALYLRQTKSEQNSRKTLNRNGVGFTGPDARKLTNIALLANKGIPMMPMDLAILRKAIPKYWRQLAEIAQEREAAKQAEVEAVIAARVQAYGEYA